MKILQEKVKIAYKNGHNMGYLRGLEEGWREAYTGITHALESITKKRLTKFKPLPRYCMRCAEEYHEKN